MHWGELGEGSVARYTKEAGVRSLERRIGAVMRWAALRRAEEKEQQSADKEEAVKQSGPLIVDEGMLHDILGVSLF